MMNVAGDLFWLAVTAIHNQDRICVKADGFLDANGFMMEPISEDSAGAGEQRRLLYFMA